jgi:histidinol-phosphate phosphatase family protein
MMLDLSQGTVLLDRDGVINRRIVKGYVKRWKDFAFLPGVLSALRMLRENGYQVLVVSNQSCVGRGLLSWEELQAITRRMQLEVALAGGAIEKVYYCHHAPGDDCSCRKPRPGLLLAARAGCRSVLVQRGAFLQHGALVGTMKNVVSDLQEAASLIVRRDTPTLSETLCREWPQFHSAWNSARHFSNPSKRNHA